MGNFYLVCGISGGGKTFLSHYIHNLNPSITEVLDVDEYYARINGDERIRANAFQVWHTLYQDLHDFEIEGKDVILTTNSLTASQRQQFIEWFPSYTHHCIWVIAPWERCVKGNFSRKRQIPLEVLREQWEQMEFPNASEKGWETITQVTNWWSDIDEETNYTVFKLIGDINTFIKF